MKVLPGYMPKSGIAGSYGSSIFGFPVVVVPIYIPTSSVEGFPFLHTLTFVICGFINDGHSDWYEEVYCGSFELHFSNNQ